MNQKILDVLNNYDVTLDIIKNAETPLIEIPVYVINLDINKFRRSYIKYITKKMKINYTLVIVKKITDELKYKVTKKLKNGVLGCYLSHLWCINDAIQKNYKHFLIFEDDIVFHKNFEKMFKNLRYKDYDMIQMGCCDFNFHTNTKDCDIKDNIYYPKKLALGAYGNIYNLNFAKIIFKEKINNCEEFDTSFDMYYNKYKMGICYPNIITTELSTTNLHHDFSFFNKRKNDYFVKKCFENFDYSNYYFIWIVFIEYCYEIYKKNKNNKMLSNSDYNEIINEFCDKQITEKKNMDNKDIIKNVLTNNNISVTDINEMLITLDNDKYV